MVVKNAQLLLDGLLRERRMAEAPAMRIDDFFETFCAAEVLKSYDLTSDDIQLGLIGGGGDGGIDGLYAFVDGDPLDDSNHAVRGRRDMNVEIVVLQCKNTTSFSGTALDKLISTMTTLFDLGRPVAELRPLYNERLVERARMVRQLVTESIAQIST